MGRGKYVGGAVNGDECYFNKVCYANPVVRVSSDEESFSSGYWGGGGGKGGKNTFTKENTSPDFRQKREGRGLLLCLLLLNCVHVHITFMSKQHIWGGIFWSHVVFIFPQHRTAVGWGHVFLSIPYWFPVEFWVQSRDPLLLSELKLEYSQL